MKRTLATITAMAVAGCSAEPIVLNDQAGIIELTGGPASISSKAEGIAYHLPTAQRICREQGRGDARSAGASEDGFIVSYLYACDTAG